MTTRQVSAFRNAMNSVRERSIIAMALACVALAGCGESSQSKALQEYQPAPLPSEQTSVDADGLKQLLQQCDVAKLTPALRDVLGLPSAADVLAFLNDSWDSGGGDPAITACMQKDVVRVYVANALAQAQSNRMLEVARLPSVLDALRGSLASQNSEVVQVAMMGLGDFLTESDTALLGQIAVGQNPANAKVAISTLALSCTPSASKELDRLAETDTARRNEVRDARQRMQEARKTKCGSASN
jgi:hypothetical protein